MNTKEIIGLSLV